MSFSDSTRLISDITPGTFSWMCSRRCLSGWAGSATSGKLTEVMLVPLSEKVTSFSDTSTPMFSWASRVEPPMCGVRMTFSRPRSGLSNSSALPLGSTGKTSMAAPLRRPSLIASARASITTTLPRAALIRMAPGFIRLICSSPIIQRVDGRSGTCRLTTSERASSSSRLAT